jgi:hypothetical protein
MARQRTFRTWTAACAVALCSLLAIGTTAAAARTTSAKPVDPTLASAYANYLSAIDDARNIVHAAPFLQDDADHQLAESFLGGITTFAVAQALDLTPDQPVMQQLPHTNVRLGFNNPDNVYYMARVSDQDSYLITGKRGTSTGFVLQALAGISGNGNAAGATTASITSEDLHLNPDGTFAITLSPTQPAQGDWIPMRPGTDNLLVRFTFLDWANEEPGSINMQRIGGPAADFTMTSATAGAMLNDAATTIRLQAQFYRDQGAGLASLGPNRLIGPRKAQGDQGTNVQQWNLIGTYQLEQNQALVIKIKDAPQARYANIMTSTPFLDSLPFVHNQSSLNRWQAHVDSDGYIRYVVSATDPHVPNWIDTVGTRHGILFARWQQVTGDLGPDYAPTLNVVNVDDVRSVLPAETPTVSWPERVQALQQRERLLATRFKAANPKPDVILDRLKDLEHLLGNKLPVQYLDVPTI